MKSSAPLFTKKNPFQPASKVGKAHYHPSCNQSLSKEKKKTTLSPVRSTRRSCPRTNSQTSPQPPDKCGHRLSAADGGPDFSESWPSTDCGSSPTATTPDMETAKHSARAGKSTVPTGVQQDSVLAKYVERFRHGEPQSREERQQEHLPFWWISPSSSTPAKNTDKDRVIQPLTEDHVPAIFGPAGQRRRDRSPSPFKGSLSILSDTSHSEFDDTEILHLQARASRLLLRETEDHECTLSDGSVPVSSDGLGCSDLSSPVSVDEPVRRHWIPAKTSANLVPAVSSLTSAIPSLGPPTRPEEDILFQWRLRRKMEQAREWPRSLQHPGRHGTIASWQASGLHHPSAGEQAYKQQQSCQPPEFLQKDPHSHITAPQPEAKGALGSFPSTSAPTPSPAYVVSSSSVSQHPTAAHVPAHMHLLCDVLPCPIQLSRATAQQNISQKTKVPDNPTDIFTDEPIHEHMLSSTHAPSGAREEKQQPLHNKRTNKKQEAQPKDKNEKMLSIQKENKSTRYAAVDEELTGGLSSSKGSHSHQRLPKKAMPLAKLQQQGVSSGSCSRDHAPPPPSPVHSALGQVVSEVLFPAVDRSPAPRSPDSLVSPPCTFSAPPQSPAPPRDTQDSVEVISQLLQEAEDSDEKEFEDDTLLQVLRKQRKWVKQQISEVESMLTDFLGEQQVT